MTAFIGKAKYSGLAACAAIRAVNQALGHQLIDSCADGCRRAGIQLGHQLGRGSLAILMQEFQDGGACGKLLVG